MKPRTKQAVAHLLDVAKVVKDDPDSISLEDRRYLVKSLAQASKLLLAKCPHSLPLLTPRQLDDEWLTVSAVCEICGEDFGWRCKSSPDTVCHYHTSTHRKLGRGVYLNTGKFFPLPDELLGVLGDSDNENSDSCIFCGQPDERK